MNRERILIEAPSRIHCGLLSVGSDLPVNFGGCGIMISEPAVQLELGAGPGERDHAEADCVEIQHRVIQVLERLRQGLRRAEPRECYEETVAIRVLKAPPRHSGFGSGTQLALATAVAAMNWWGLDMPAAGELAVMLGRGRRSAIGTYGFFQGGFLVDNGVEGDQLISPLGLRLEFPDWPIALIEFPALQGVHGIEELKAFDKIVAGDAEARYRMEGLLHEKIVPSIARQDFELFSSAIYEFGARSGDCYREFQGGTFHGPAVDAVVNEVRDAGFKGVIQSSWGPTLAVFLNSIEEFENLKDVGCRFQKVLTRITMTSASNRGFKLTRAIGNRLGL